MGVWKRTFTSKKCLFPVGIGCSDFCGSNFFLDWRAANSNIFKNGWLERKLGQEIEKKFRN